MTKATLSFQLPAVISHRGAKLQVPENTLLAFETARQLGASCVEFDVRCTQDGVPVIFHDDTLDRLCGQANAFTDLSFRELREARLQGCGHYQANIPTLIETMSYLERHGLQANIELKSPSHHPEPVWLTAHHARIICLCLKNILPHFQNYLLSSFSFSMLEIARTILPTMPLALLLHFEDFSAEWPKRKSEIADLYRSLGCATLNLNDAQLNLRDIQELRTLSNHILVYTINSKTRAQQLLEMGVRSVFSDTPNLLAK